MVKLNFDDELVFDALAMHCFQAVNAVIELGESIVSERKLGFPSKYREIFENIKKTMRMKSARFLDAQGTLHTKVWSYPSSSLTYYS